MKKLFSILIVLGILVVDASAQSTGSEKSAKDLFVHQKRFSSIVESGLGLSKSPGDSQLSASYFVNYVYGYQPNTQWYTGLSVGLRKYTFVPTYQSFADLQLPITLYAKVNLNKRRFSPFIVASFGGSSSLNNGFGWVGLVGAGQIGLNISLSSRRALSIATGYENQQMTLTEADPYTDWTGTTTFGRQAIRWHIAFQF